MAVLTKEELFAAVKETLGDSTSDNAISFIENITDTYNALVESKEAETSDEDKTDWKAKFEENDTTWRNKYKERFFEGKREDGDPKSNVDLVNLNSTTSTEDSEPETPETFDELFTQEKEN